MSKRHLGFQSSDSTDMDKSQKMRTGIIAISGILFLRGCRSTSNNKIARSRMSRRERSKKINISLSPNPEEVGPREVNHVDKGSVNNNLFTSSSNIKTSHQCLNQVKLISISKASN